MTKYPRDQKLRRALPTPTRDLIQHALRTLEAEPERAYRAAARPGFFAPADIIETLNALSAKEYTRTTIEQTMADMRSRGELAYVRYQQGSRDYYQYAPLDGQAAAALAKDKLPNGAEVDAPAGAGPRRRPGAVYIHADDWHKLEQRARRLGMNRSEYVRSLIERLPAEEDEVPANQGPDDEELLLQHLRVQSQGSYDHDYDGRQRQALPA